MSDVSKTLLHSHQRSEHPAEQGCLIKSAQATGANIVQPQEMTIVKTRGEAHVVNVRQGISDAVLFSACDFVFCSGQAGEGSFQKVPSSYLLGTHVVHV